MKGWEQDSTQVYFKKDSTKLEKSLSINEVQGKVNGKNQEKKGH